MYPNSIPNDLTIEVEGRFEDLDACIEIKSIDEQYFQLFEFNFWFSKSRLRIGDFGKRIIYESVINNKINEKVLAASDLELNSSNFSEMELAYTKLSNYLESSILTNIEEVLIDSCEETLLSLLDAKNLCDK